MPAARSAALPRERKRCGSDLLNWGRGASPGYWG
jgi:hypothetical protein